MILRLEKRVAVSDLKNGKENGFFKVTSWHKLFL